MEGDLVYVVPDIPTIAQGDALSASLPGPLDVSVPRVVEPAEIEAGGGIGSLPVPEPTARGPLSQPECGLRKPAVQRMWYPIAFASWNLNVLCLASHLNRYRPGEKHCSGFLDGAFVAVFAYADCYTTDCCSVVPHTVTLRTLVSRGWGDQDSCLCGRVSLSVVVSSDCSVPHLWSEVFVGPAPTPGILPDSPRRLPDRTDGGATLTCPGAPSPQGPNGGRKNFGASNCSSALLHSVAHSCPNLVTERPRDPCGPPPRPQAPPPQVHKTTICPFDHYSDGKTPGPLRTTPLPPPQVHETTICPFDHYSHGATTGPLRTTAPTPGPTPRSTKPLFVHLTIIVTERPRDPCGPPPDPMPHPQVHETTICPFDHYSHGATTGPLRTTARPQAPPPVQKNSPFLQKRLRSRITATFSPESEIVASSSTVFYPTQGTILCENSSWLDRFQVPWDKMRPDLKRAIGADKRPEPEDRRHMERVIVDSMRVHCLNPSRKDCSAVAKEITQKYSQSFLDKTEEYGCGYFSLMNQLKTRIDIEYQVEAATTLEFVQRFLVRINPESSKCSSKVQTSRKSGKKVKRKTSYMNPRVAFMRDFTNFDWQNN
ncbi:hypothetical protein G5714_002531 [Onychostoma macrolepis]|uniref:Uncharacterized protein n=1 Tax=Onychostoma macrolepis TaxID=369639 RepID=A0A7J6D7B2_9TELE|nr:hypothetical protein G5714_002531 [Onychostoma macrolepis]